MEQARQVITSLLATSSQAVISFATSNDLEPGLLRRGSVLFRKQQFESQAPTPINTQSAAWETFVDRAGLPLSKAGRVGSGIGLLTDQSNCAFRAYARHRLKCASEEEPEFGLDALERGSLIHALLESAWNELHTSAELTRLIDTGELDQFCTQIVSKTLSEFVPLLSPEKASLIALEHQRLTALLNEWLQHESKRPSDFAVVSTEEDGEHTLGNLSFRYKIDRVDLLDDGRSVVVDYKTGQISRSDLHGERLRQPQLAVYFDALSKQKNKAPAGVALAKVKAFECEFGELAETDIFRNETSYARKHAEQWESARVDWSSQLERLALAFEAGEADLNPIDAKTCLYCDLQALCRINQVSSQNLEGVQDDE